MNSDLAVAVGVDIADNSERLKPCRGRRVDVWGLTALAFDSGRRPPVCDEPAATYDRASNEHGRLAVSAETSRLGLGDKIRLIPGHCDPTVNPHPFLPRERGRDWVRARADSHHRTAVGLVGRPGDQLRP